MSNLVAISSNTLHQAFASVEDYQHYASGAKRHTEIEKAETVRGALKQHWRAIS